MKAVVLAAGEGARLRPITATRPKHMIEVGGKPLLDHCLRNIKTAGIEETVIVVHYLADVIQSYLKDGGEWGVRLEYAEQGEMLGTGNAIETIEAYVEEDFLVVYGDLLFDPEALRKVIRVHRKQQPSATIGVVAVERPEEYGIVEIEAGRVKRLREKPSSEEVSGNLANAGIYVFSKSIFEKIDRTRPSVRGEWEITDAISLMIEDGETVSAAKIARGDWLDVGRPWNLLEANQWALSRGDHQVSGNVEDGAHLIGGVTVAKTARIRSGAYIEGPVVIGEESDIGPNCYIRPYTSIGKNVRVGNGCEIKNSIVMDDTHIGHLSYVGDSIVGENCNFGAGTVTANLRLDDENVEMKVKGETVDTERRKLGAILGDGVKTGINVLFMPGVKVGVNSWIGPNVILYRDVDADKLITLEQTIQEEDLKA
ncbi:MAG: bifunctional sugar-1-phosphate nucleotidylyltransferase/acetyltransferase [Thermoproteota archaeon]